MEVGDMTELKDVSFSYAAAPEKGCIKHMDLTVPDGQFLLLTGGSGCGKSTVIRLLNGLVPHFFEGELSGDVLIDGRSVPKMELYETAAMQGTVFQNPRAQFFTVDTAGELAFGCENQGLPEAEILSRIDRTVERFRIADLMDRNIFAMSGGEKQKIACASVDTLQPPLILLDEPSANLDYASTMKLREIIKLWKAEGRTIIAAEHRLYYLWDIADRALLIRDGSIAEDWSRADMDTMTNEKLAKHGLRSIHDTDPAAIERSCSRGEVFSVKPHKRFTFPTEIPLHEITAVVGRNGAGKTTFLRHMCRSARRSRRIFMVMQDVDHQLFTDSVLEEVLISLPDEDEGKAREILRSLDLEDYADRHPMSLSGGQKQRVAIACAAASGRDILLFDEPTSGLDYEHMQQTAQLFGELREQGRTILVVTHDSELIEACCTNIMRLE